MSNMPPPPPPGGNAPPPPPGGGTPPPPGGGTPPPFGGPPAAQTGMPPRATFGKRFGAAIIDSLVTGAMAIPAWIALAAGPTEIKPCSSSFNEGLLCETKTGGAVAIFLLLLLVAIAGAVAYFGIMEGKGQTVGKKALNIRTADIATGQPIGTGRAIGRYFARIPSAMFCYIGYLWMLWDDQQQTWHDKIVSTVVVDA